MVEATLLTTSEVTATESSSNTEACRRWATETTALREAGLKTSPAEAMGEGVQGRATPTSIKTFLTVVELMLAAIIIPREMSLVQEDMEQESSKALAIKGLNLTKRVSMAVVKVL